MTNTIDFSKYEVNDSWGKSTDYKKPFEYTVPSGKIVLVRRLDMTDILRLGMIEDLDFMAKALVTDDKNVTEAENDAAVLRAFAGKNFIKLEALVNAVVAGGIVAPKLHLPPEHEAARQAGLRYVDSVSLDDRMDLFGVIFDSDGLSTFRKEQDPSVADIPNVTDISLPAE